MSNKRNIFWPKVDSIEDAKAASRAGAWAAIFVATITGFVSILSFAGIRRFGEVEINLWSLIDSAIFLLIAWGLFRYSRVAAVMGLLIYIAERIDTIASGLTGGFL